LHHRSRQAPLPIRRHQSGQAAAQLTMRNTLVWGEGRRHEKEGRGIGEFRSRRKHYAADRISERER
jgi:hypothetical protein